MKLYRKKGTKTKKRTTRRIRKRNYKNNFGSKVSSLVANSQRLNIQKNYHTFKETINWNTIAGTGGSLGVVETFKVSELARYSALVSMYRQYKVNYIKHIITLNTYEYTDNAQKTKMYIRYNYDPDLIAGSLTEDYMVKQSNMIVKVFGQGSPNDAKLLYRIKPCVMGAKRLYSSNVYVPSPLFNQWCDFDPSTTTDELGFYGWCYFIPNIPTGQQLEHQLEISITCRDLI